jgi:ribonucleoside-diphosphate reductase alpha chain
MQWDAIIRNNGTLKNVGVPSNVKRIYKTALEIPIEWHIKHQAVFQQYVDAAVSKTINCAYETTPEQIEAAIMMAWNMGCKGITVYRDGSRAEQVLSSGRRQITKPKERPQIIDAKVIKIKTGCGSMFATIGTDDGQILEVLTNIGRSGGCAQAMTEALCRVISIALRAGIDIELIVEQLDGIRCPHIGPGVGEKPALSCADALAKAIKKIRPDIKISPKPVAPCPKCGGKLMFSEGCESCMECDYQRCG